ncbi:hypothetical protein SH2C18_30190 [Clostridium sediminicola]|uniref:tetratricopeptide repeat protein n=1 Tax=Clostridium sediminicola TaxID=3114879 RepID=UPI0031F1DA7B
MNLVQKIIIKYASTCISKGKVEKALKLVKSIESLEYEKFFYEGVCYFEMGSFYKAKENLEHALSLKEDYNCARVLFEIYIQIKEWDNANEVIKNHKNKKGVKTLIKIIKDENKRERYATHNKNIYLALKCIREKKYDNSIAYYQQALGDATDKANIYNQIGGIYLNYIKDKQKAEEYFSMACNMKPANKIYKMNYAKVKLS